METPQTLTTQESRSIITEMIQRAKGNVRANSKYFVVWGIVMIVANIGMFILIKMSYAYPYYAWAIAIPAWFYSIYLGIKRGQQKRVTSHLEQITGTLWMAFGISTIALVVFGHMINYEMNPVILIWSAVPTLVSGVVIRFRPLIIGGINFWICGILCFLVPCPWEYIIGAVAVTIGFLIPGILLLPKRKSDAG
jgi:hypothetical protein